MSNIALAWAAEGGGDWQILGGRTRTGGALASAVLISLFTDRVAQPDYRAEDGSSDRHGWWHDTFEGVPIGSRLWQLRRRKIADHAALANEARDIAQEALAWMIDAGLAARAVVEASLPPAGPGRSGTLLLFTVRLERPAAPAPLVRALWSAV